MSIRRAPRPETNFYLLDKRISEDKRLSWGARGMLIFLLGKPDHWEVSVANLINETTGSTKKSGRDAVYGMLKELESAGYLSRDKARSKGGEFGGVDYIVHESPLTEKPETVKPYTDEPDTVNPTQVSIEGVVSNETPARNEKPLVSSDDVTAVFEFWKTQMGKTRTTKLDTKRRTKIKNALADYGIEQVQQAITGCTLSAHHMGQNPQNKRYDDIELILRDAKHVEQFLGYYDRKPTNVSLYDNRPRPVHSGLANANAEGLRQRADGAYSL